MRSGAVKGKEYLRPTNDPRDRVSKEFGDNIGVRPPITRLSTQVKRNAETLRNRYREWVKSKTQDGRPLTKTEYIRTVEHIDTTSRKFQNLYRTLRRVGRDLAWDKLETVSEMNPFYDEFTTYAAAILMLRIFESGDVRNGAAEEVFFLTESGVNTFRDSLLVGHSHQSMMCFLESFNRHMYDVSLGTKGTSEDQDMNQTGKSSKIALGTPLSPARTSTAPKTPKTVQLAQPLTMSLASRPNTAPMSPDALQKRRKLSEKEKEAFLRELRVARAW